MSLHIVQVREMGRYELTSNLGLLGFKTGITFPVQGRFWRKMKGMLSGPAAELGQA